MVRLILVIFVLLLRVGLSAAQTYQLGNDVLDDGGTKMTSTGYILKGSFGQPTIGKISSSGYVAYIGFWHPPYAPGPGVEEELLVPSPVPIVFSLSQNYPNPFSRITLIRYQVAGDRLPVAGDRQLETGNLQHVSLSIYDLSGRLVRTLVDEPQEPGYYSVTWDLRGVSGERLPSGVYFYKLKACPEHGRGAGQFVRTRKLVVLR